MLLGSVIVAMATIVGAFFVARYTLLKRKRWELDLAVRIRIWELETMLIEVGYEEGKAHFPPGMRIGSKEADHRIAMSQKKFRIMDEMRKLGVEPIENKNRK